MTAQASLPSRLHHTAYVSREIFEARIIHLRARLIAIGLELIDVDIKRRPRRGDRVGRVGDQRTKPLAECWSFFHN